LRGNLGQQPEQHRRVADGVAGHLDGAYPQRLGVDAQMNLAPITPGLGAMLFAFYSPSPRNLMPVLSASNCSGDLLGR